MGLAGLPGGASYGVVGWAGGDVMPSNSTPEKHDLATYSRVVWRRKAWVVGTVVLGVAVAAAYALASPKVYSATAQILVQPQGGSVSAIDGTPVTITATNVLTESQLLAAPPVADAVKAELHEDNLSVRTSVVTSTNLISVSASDQSPVMAARIANSYANAFVKYENNKALAELQTAEGQLTSQITAINAQLPNVSSASQSTALVNEVTSLKEELTRLQVDGTQAAGGVQVEVAAAVPTAPSSPKKTELGVLGLFGGLVLGIALALVIDRADDKVRTEDDVEQSGLGYPLFGVIPRVGARWKKDRPQVVTLASPTSPGAEAYRNLRTSLGVAARDGEIKSILVTSPAASDGKTTLVASLGVAMASAGNRVLLVSSDLRRPQLAALFGLTGRVGLTSVMMERSNVKQALQPVSGVDGLSVLASGPIPTNPAETLGSHGFAEVVNYLHDSFNWVIFDGPPLLPVADSLILSQMTDVTLLVVAAGQTTHSQLERACHKLDRARVRNVGLVLNGASATQNPDYASYQAGESDGGVKVSCVPSKIAVVPDKKADTRRTS